MNRNMIYYITNDNDSEALGAKRLYTGSSYTTKGCKDRFGMMRKIWCMGVISIWNAHNLWWVFVVDKGEKSGFLVDGHLVHWGYNEEGERFYYQLCLLIMEDNENTSFERYINCPYLKWLPTMPFTTVIQKVFQLQQCKKSVMVVNSEVYKI